MASVHSVWRSRMYLTRFLRLGAAGLACALVLFATDFWKTKDSAMWTSEEINKLLSRLAVGQGEDGSA